MSLSLFSRRDFSRTIGRSFALAFAGPRLSALLAAERPAEAAGGAIRLNANENPYGPSPKALEALAGCGSTAGRYPDPVLPRMREAIARSHGVKPENILLGCGSSEILRVADLAFLAPGQNVVAAEPTFEAVLSYARVTRAEAVKVPLTADHRHDLPRMAAACTSKTALVYVCNPNNPTGTVVHREEMKEFVERVPPATLILVDEAYYHFPDDPDYSSVIDWIGQHPNLVVARTFSKVYGLAGMRLGYGVATKETIERMGRHTIWDNCNAGVLPAALASLGDADYVESCRSRLNGSRRWLVDQLPKDGRRCTDSQTNFVMIDLGSDVEPVIEQFKKRNILVGRRFPSMSNFLRVSIGTQPEMETFLAALREIAPARESRAA
ncbi:MAG TPA: histidinol-phosphate transaminase [Candidatus Sulfotelmatobacter sp.]|nr:histidinol-phosphate transaminase [Candidatus Sulfotelmatobacter sp.]